VKAGWSALMPWENSGEGLCERPTEEDTGDTGEEGLIEGLVELGKEVEGP